MLANVCHDTSTMSLPRKDRLRCVASSMMLRVVRNSRKAAGCSLPYCSQSDHLSLYSVQPIRLF